MNLLRHSRILEYSQCVMSTSIRVITLIKVAESEILMRLVCVCALGISSLASCGEVEALPELPAQDEERLQRAARLLQQRLVLRQWLLDHGLHNHYQRYITLIPVHCNLFVWCWLFFWRAHWTLFENVKNCFWKLVEPERCGSGFERCGGR